MVSITNPEFVVNCIERFKGQHTISSVDCKITNSTYKTFGYSDLRSTKTNAMEHIYKLIQYGADKILLSLINKDGTKR